jgi:hypothetical protein
MRRFLLGSWIVFAPLGCSVGLAQASVAPTGCAEEDIRIFAAHTPLLGQGAPTRWNATCNGVTYFCIQTRDRTICSEDPRATGHSKPKKATDAPVASANMVGKP